MREKSLTIFDFDGTLYPINTYDSEQLLILSAAKERGVLFKKRGKHFIAQDQRGGCLTILPSTNVMKSWLKEPPQP